MALTIILGVMAAIVAVYGIARGSVELLAIAVVLAVGAIMAEKVKP